MENKNNHNPNELRDWRIKQTEDGLIALAARVTGIELWKSKIEDNIQKRNENNGVNGQKATDKDWIKIIIMALTIISSLVLLVTKVILDR